MDLQEIKEKKRHGDTQRIAQVANNMASERGVKTYSETTVRQMLNGTRTLKPIVMEAVEKYYKLFNSNDVQQSNK